MKKIRIAFVKYGGMTSGGSEKLLQIIAANLPKEEFEVSYFYCDPASTSAFKTDASRIKFMTDHKVRLIKFSVDHVDYTVPTFDWRGTDFWKVFNENDYDIVQTCRSGHKEYPFYKIRKTPIVDIIALSSGSDNQYNISRVVHISKWSAKGWVKRGGDKSRIVIGSLPIAVEKKVSEISDLREQYNLQGKFIFGMHQRPSNDIFSAIPLVAYKQAENENTIFVLLGGGSRYKEQAKELGIKNIIFLEPAGDISKIFSFLKTLDVYAHGRADGEVNSQAIAEAFYFGLPIVSHFSKINNGHVEEIGEAGKVVHNASEYAQELTRLMTDTVYYREKSNKALQNFADNYELRNQISKYAELYRNVAENPFPNKVRRFLSSLHYTQNIRVLAVFVYLKLRHYFPGLVPKR